MKKLIGLLLFVFSFNALALQQYETADFNEVSRKIYELGQKFGTQNVLVVYDIDNTLLAMKTDLGTDQWFDWQSALLTTPESPLLVAKDFDGLLKVQGFLYSLGRMRLTQEDLPAIYQDVTTHGYQQIILTSRGPEFRDATERELLRNKLPVWNTTAAQNVKYEMPYDPNNLAASCLTEADRVPFKLGTPRMMSVGKNMILSSGQHKGMALKTVLCRMNRSYKAIVFADDKISNVNAMVAAFGAAPDVELVTYRYSREDARVEAFAKGDKKQAITDWNTFAPILKNLFEVYP